MKLKPLTAPQSGLVLSQIGRVSGSVDCVVLKKMKYKALSEEQITAFKSISGKEYDGISLHGDFVTNCPFDMSDWEGSPWCFHFQFDPSAGNLYCKLSHRMTNDRVFGYAQDGSFLKQNLLDDIFPESVGMF